MQRRFQNGTVAGQALLKTGTLEGVRALAGYVIDDEGRRFVVVAIVNHANAARAQGALDYLVQWVYETARRGTRRNTMTIFGLEHIAEAQDREATRAGAFDNLPGSGRPLDLDDDRLVPEDLAARLPDPAQCRLRAGGDREAQRSGRSAPAASPPRPTTHGRKRARAGHRLRRHRDGARSGGDRSARLATRAGAYRAQLLARLGRSTH